MKYLLVAHYAGFDLDDPEDLVSTSWLVGETTTETEAEILAAKEIENYINEQIENRFDLDDEDLDQDEVEAFRKRYEVSVTSIRIPTEKMEEIATLYLNAEYYFEDLKIEVIKLED